MIYKNFKDLKLSALGMGCMRLPVVDNNDSNIDEQKTAEMVGYAMVLIIMILLGVTIMAIQKLLWEMF